MKVVKRAGNCVKKSRKPPATQLVTICIAGAGPGPAARHEYSPSFAVRTGGPTSVWLEGGAGLGVKPACELSDETERIASGPYGRGRCVVWRVSIRPAVLFMSMRTLVVKSRAER